MKKAGKEKIWKPFIDFYTKFKIPWYLFLISSLLGIVYTEIDMRLAKYIIAINKGELFNGTIIGYVILMVINSIIVVFQNMANAYGSGKITLRARRVLWKKVLNIPIITIDREKPSSLISGVTIDAAKASETITMVFLFVSSIYGFIRAFTILYAYNSTLTTYMLLLVPLAVFLFFIVGRLQFLMLRKQYSALKVMTGFFSEHLSSAKHIKANSMEEYEIEEGYRIINERYKADIFFAFMTSLQTFINAIYSNLCTVVVAVGGSKLISSGRLESTGINNFNAYLNNENKYLSELLIQYQSIKGVQGVLKNVNKILDFDEETKNSEIFLEEAYDKEDLVFKNVSFGYDDREVLHNISLRIPYGKTTAIIGDNGSGKSTLLKLIQRFYIPNKGEICLGDRDISKLNLEDLRRKFAYVLQNTTLFSGTVKENIVYGFNRKVSDEDIEKAAKLADAHDFITKLKYGYDTNVGEGGSRLSGGQRQRIAIARALILNANWVLLDEACASLDHKSDLYIYNSIKRVMKDKSIVLIAHEMQEVIEADNIIVLSDGKVEATGTHEELFKISKTYREYMEKHSLMGGNRI